MNREIKFRFYHKGLNKFIDFEPKWYGGKISYNSEVIQCQQFTGLKDKNGKEIYEGDLVQFRYASQPDIQESLGVYEVYFDEQKSAFYLRVIRKNWYDTMFKTVEQAQKETIDAACPVLPLLTLPIGDFRICEVIGNIFQNTELIVNQQYN